MAKADLNINVKVSGSEKAEKQLEGVGKAAKKAGDGAKKAGGEFKGFGDKAGDVSENLDKNLEQSVGRSFKGFDRLTSIVGQATGALALVTGGFALLKLGYDKLIVPQLESTRLFKEQQREASQLADRVLELKSAYDELTGSIQANIEEIDRLDAARLASGSKIVQELTAQLPVIDAELEKFERKRRRAQAAEAKAQRDVATGSVMGIAIRAQAARDEARVARKSADESVKRLLEQRASVVEALARERGILARLRDEIRDIFSFHGPPAPSDAPPGKPAPRRSLAGKQRESAIELFEQGLAAETEAENAAETNRQALRASAAAVDLARAADADRQRASLAKESRARLMERERIDQETRIALIQDVDDRERAIIEARQRDEFSHAEQAGADLFQLKRAQSAETEAFEEQVSARRRARQQEEIQRTIGTVNAISGALAQGAKAFGLGVGVEMFAAGLQDAGTAASEGSKAAARFAVFDVIGGAAHTLAAGLAGAAAIKNFAGAAQLGKGGGGGGGTPVAAIPAPPPRRSDIGEGGRGEAVTNINVTFTGRSFVTQREIREDVAGLLGSRGRGGRVVA
jgi:hypothetical protein